MLKVQCTGRLIKDPKTNDPTDGKKPCTTFTLAVNEYAGTNPDNSPRYESVFLNCVAFDRMATSIAKCVKGDTLEIYGNIRAELYETKEGKPGTSLRSVVRDWEKVASAVEKKKEVEVQVEAEPDTSEDSDPFN